MKRIERQGTVAEQGATEGGKESKEEKRKRPTNFTSLPPFRRFDKGKERREFLSWLNFNRHFRGNPPADVTDLKTKRNVTPAEAFDTQRLSIGRQSRA
jgi:hypothetical protein